MLSSPRPLQRWSAQATEQHYLGRPSLRTCLGRTRRSSSLFLVCVYERGPSWVFAPTSLSTPSTPPQAACRSSCVSYSRFSVRHDPCHCGVGLQPLSYSFLMIWSVMAGWHGTCGSHRHTVTPDRRGTCVVELASPSVRCLIHITRITARSTRPRGGGRHPSCLRRPPSPSSL